MSKKRDKTKYPGLKQDVNLKSRRYLLDNISYSHRLDEEDKEYLSDFNEAYYGNNRNLKYDNMEIIEAKLSKEDYNHLKQQMSELRNKRRLIWNKPADRTTNEDREEAYRLTEQIEEISDFLYKMVPTRKMTKDNKARENDFLTMTHANNTYELVSWEDLRDKELAEVMDEAIFSPIDWEEE